DARLLPVIADAAQRPLPKRAGLVDAEMDPVGWHGCCLGLQFSGARITAPAQFGTPAEGVRTTPTLPSPAGGGGFAVARSSIAPSPASGGGWGWGWEAI